MNLRVLTFILLLVAVCLTTCSVWFVRLSWGDPFLVQFAGVTGLNFLLVSLLWIGYSVYAMFWLVPKADAIVDPELSEQLQRRGDFTFYRIHRLTFYAFSSASRWANGRLHPEFDFRRLPSCLRIPFVVHFYGMWLGCLLLVVGYATIKLAEMWGMNI